MNRANCHLQSPLLWTRVQAFLLYCLLFFVMAAALTTVCQAGQAEDALFEDANRLYSQGEYGQAIGKYQQIAEVAGYSSSLLYNLANSYAQMGQPGRAILNYERALRLSPSDIDISGNLQLVKKENGLFPKEPTRTERFFKVLNLNQWTILTLIPLVLACCFLAASLRYHFSRQWKIGMTTGCLLCFILGTSATLYNYRLFNPAVIISAEVKLYVSPFEGSASVGSLKEGRLVYPKKIHGNFSYVVDETERKGWVQSTDLELVCPR